MKRHLRNWFLIGLAAVMLAGAFPAEAWTVQAAGVIKDEDMTLWLPAAADTLGDMAIYCETDTSVMRLSGVNYADADGHQLPSGHRFTVGEEIIITIWMEPAAGHAFDGTSSVNIHRLVAGKRPGGYMHTPLDGVNDGHGRFVLNWTVPFRDVLEFDSFYYPDIQYCAGSGYVQGWDDGTFRPLNTCNRAAVITFLWRMSGETYIYANADSPFTDVDKSNPFYAAIMWAYYTNIAGGYDDGTFRPWEPCNRAAILTFFWRLANSPNTYQNYPSPFSDVDGTNPFYPALMWAYNKHLVTGYDDGTLRPWAQCNRLAVACFISRYMTYVPVG